MRRHIRIHSRGQRTGLALAMTLFAAASQPALAATTNWAVTDLGMVPGYVLAPKATSINASGQIVGSVDVYDPYYSGSMPRATAWQNGTPSRIGGLAEENGAPSYASYAIKINDPGDVLINRYRFYGATYYAADSQAYVKSASGVLTAADGLTAGRDMNNAGQIVGLNKEFKSVLWQNGTATLFGTLPNQDPYSNFVDVSHINNLGQVVGVSSSSRSQGGEAFIWQNGTMQALGDLPGGNFRSTANDINDLGQVVGQGQTYGPFAERGSGFQGYSKGQAFLWQNGSMVALQSLPGEAESSALSLNNRGQIIGSSTDAQYNVTSLLWDQGQLINLSTLAEVAAGGLHGFQASAINDLGQIVGSAQTASGVYRAVMLTPVPEPSSHLLALACIGLFAGRARLRRGARTVH